MLLRNRKLQSINIRVCALLLAIVFLTAGQGVMPAKAWSLRSGEDKITGVKTVAITQSAMRTRIVPHRRPERTSPDALLQVQCVGKTANVFVYVKDTLVGGSSGNEVQYKFDDAKPVTSRWEASTDSSAVGLWTTSQTRVFIAKAQRKKTLIFRTTHDVFGTIEAEFDVNAMEQNLSQVKAQCKI
jgi:hypothetical protein